jgi:hypothetical protein
VKSIIFIIFAYIVSPFLVNGQNYQIAVEKPLIQYKDNVINIKGLQDISTFQLTTKFGQIVKLKECFMYKTESKGLETFVLFEDRQPIDTFCLYVNSMTKPEIGFKHLKSIGKEFYIDSIIVGNKNYEIKKFCFSVVDPDTNELVFVNNQESSGVLSKKTINFLMNLIKSKINKRLKFYLTEFTLIYNGFEISNSDFNASYLVYSDNIIIPNWCIFR